MTGSKRQNRETSGTAEERNAADDSAEYDSNETIGKGETNIATSAYGSGWN